MADKPEIYYDRAVHPDLHEQLAKGGVFWPIVELAKRRPLLDLQLRGYPWGQSRVTLYNGLTAILQIKHRGAKGFSLDAHDTYTAVTKPPKWAHGAIPWKEPLAASEWKKKRKALLRYVDAAMTRTDHKYTGGEGIYHALLGTSADKLMSVIDREAVIGFRDTKTRSRIYGELTTAVTKGLKAPKGEESWWRSDRALGGELDLLAVDSRGQLLVIEVKPGTTESGLTWSPLQVMFYAALFDRWIEDVGQNGAHETLTRMLQQRIDLGLESKRRLAKPVQVVPVVAIGGQPHVRGLSRLQTVRGALTDSNGRRDLEVWEVEPSVERTSGDAPQLMTSREECR